MQLQKGAHHWFRQIIFFLLLLLPSLTLATPAISVVATTPFLPSYTSGQTATATYTVTNVLPDLTLTIVNETSFPASSGLSVTSNTCTTLAPAATCTIQVGFTAPASDQQITGSLNLWPQPTAQGIKTPIAINVNGITITPSAGANGSISPNTAQSASYGQDITFTATPDSGYTVDIWQVDGSTVQTGGTTYELENITTAHTVSVSFIRQYTVTPSAGDNGTITPNTPENVITGNDSTTYTATPDAGYEVDQWIANTVVVQTGGTTYQATDVTEDIALSVSFKTATGIAIAAGQNITDTEGLVAVSTDAATTWSTATLPSIPPDSYFNDGVCVGTGLTGVCVAVGTETGTNVPVLFTSTDSGTTWASESVASQATTGEYHSTTCTGSTVTAICTAAGKDTTTGKAMVAVSTNGSNTWTNKTITGNPDTGIFNGTACTGTGGTAICIAAGEDVDNSQPMLGVSVDGGDTWTVPTITDIVNGTLHNASCTGSGPTATCVAAGNDIPDNDPILVQSTDGGTSWAVKYIAGAPATGTLNGVSCIDGNSTARCVAVGTGAGNVPLIAVTADNGTTWTAITSITGAPSTAVLNSVSCSGSGDTAFCAAAGNVSPPGAPFIAQSSDGGETWSTATITGAPADATLSKISCTGNTNTTVCTAFGQDTGLNDGIVIKTKDQGATWTLPTITGLPDDSDFNGGGISGGTLKSKQQ